MTSPPLLTAEVESAKTKSSASAHHLWQSYQHTGDPEAENRLVEGYLPLVRTVVGRVAMTLPTHVCAEDLYSAGLVGLLQAVRSFSPTGGASFETFARFRIRGAVLDELRRMDWVPRAVHEKARKIQNALGELEQRLDGPPTRRADRRRNLGISLDEYRPGWRKSAPSPSSAWTPRRARTRPEAPRSTTALRMIRRRTPLNSAVAQRVERT